MTFGEILYKLLIGPLELLFEVVFVFADRYVSNPAYAIIFLSLAMNFLVLPLYRRADKMQEEERDRSRALAPWIKHIRKTFKGDERFMMLQTYYRQNNYKPADSLKGSVSLFLEVPFFIAAYHFLSHLETIKGVAFGPITDLGSPDALISLGGTAVNLLPILMTLINVISAAIYMKGFPLKSKIQMYGIAAIFLVLLYKSPAGLVFYWTLNNIFSLIKNIFYKLKDPGKVLRVSASAVGLVLLIFILFVHPMGSRRAQVFMVAALLMLQLPVIMSLIKSRGHSLRIPLGEGTDLMFYASCALLTILTGLLIPSAVVSGSVEEFLEADAALAPGWYIVSAFALAAGTFMVWFGIFYRLSDDSGKGVLSLVMAATAAAGLMDYMFFGKDYGNFSADLQFDDTLQISAKSVLINLAAVLAVALIAAILWGKKRAFAGMVLMICCVALTVMSAVNVVGIGNEYKEALTRTEESYAADEPVIKLSSKGRNVVVIMMDRQIGLLVPYLVNERPELKEMFDGFTYYGNSLSFGTKTNFGSPALYGGYDYRPKAINERDDLSLEEKQNEALHVMPGIFGDEGYEVTLIEPTYAGYRYTPDLSVFDDHPEYNVYLSNDNYSLEEYGYTADNGNTTKARMRNFFCYSLFKISPQIMQPTLYHKGTYNAQKNSQNIFPQVRQGRSKATGYEKKFMSNYAFLKHMDEITKVEASDADTFLMMSNDTTHEPQMLAEPEYEPALHVDNTEFDKEHKTRKSEDGSKIVLNEKKTTVHYEVNMAALMAIGGWLDDLREKGVYDNTRIIIVSDHGHDILFKDEDGRYMYHYTNGDGEKSVCNIARYSSVLLVKDFDSNGFEMSDQPTTNADVPAMASEGLIDDPVNPYTGNAIRTYAEEPVEINVIDSHNWHIERNNGKRFEEGEWFTVDGDDLLDVNNWHYKGVE